MFKEILAVQWKSGRVGAAILTVVAFGLPLMAVQDLTIPPEQLGYRSLTPDILFSTWQVWIPIFPALAAVIGILTALNAWNWDHKAGHLYALSMPVSRRTYAMLKAAAGAVIMALPIAALSVSTFVAVASIQIPTGLNAYPLMFIGRFAMACLVMYALFFALASGTMKTVGLFFGGLVVALVVAEVGSDLLQGVFSGMPDNPVVWFYNVITEWPGPFEVYFGNWMLIDV